MAPSICHRGYVLETGKMILEGKAAELTGKDRVRQAPLGG
jgi:branched-chain amino acid transport system ATP-binding protein